MKTQTNPTVSVVMPVYNVERFVARARGEFVALLDSDDAWLPNKLERHVAHLRSDADLGVSCAGSILMDEVGRPLGIRQRPRLGRIESRHVFCGQAVQNGSAGVFRRQTLEDAALRPTDSDRVWYFDETLRRSEDVECWTRVALTTDWRFAALSGDTTMYRMNNGGLSADIIRQLESWEQVYQKVQNYAPDFIDRHGAEARARELRYLARRCVQIGDRGLALKFATEAVRTWPKLLVVEPVKTAATVLASGILRILPETSFRRLLSGCLLPRRIGVAQ